MENKTHVKPKKKQNYKGYWDARRAEGLSQSQIEEATTSLPPIVPMSKWKAPPTNKE
jgi:hypothetical protein